MRDRRPDSTEWVCPATAAGPAPRLADTRITPMRPDDIEAVLAIEHSSQPSPWPAKLFLGELERDWAYIDVVRGCDDAGQDHVLAFCNYWLVRDEVHLLNLATHPAWRRHGLANLLMQHLLAFARAHDCRFITLEVRASNQPAQALYRAHGFACVGLRPRYYAENSEDAAVMTLELEEPRPDVVSD